MRRSGYSLIETLVVIAIASVMLGIMTAMLHLLLQNDRATRAGAAQFASDSRLAERFRADVHAAAAIQKTPATGDRENLPASWQLALPGGRTVSYTTEPGGILRSESQRPGARQPESFPLPVKCTARIESHADGNSTIVSLLVVAEAQPTKLAESAERRAPVAIRIDALLGRDVRSSRQRTEDGKQ